MKTQLKAESFDRKFDDGDCILEHLNLSKARRVNIELKRVNVDFPAWVVEAPDRQAQALGVTRQSLIKLWIAERLG